MADSSQRAAVGGSLIQMASLIHADKSVSDLQGMLEKRVEYQKKSQHTSSYYSTAPEYQQRASVPKLALFPKKPSTSLHQCDSPVTSSRRQFQTARETHSYDTISKGHKDEIQALKMTIQHLAKDRDSLLAQNTELLKTSSELASGPNSTSENTKIRVLPESRSQSLGLYSCEMIDPMKRVPRSFRLRVLANHRRHSPTKTIISKIDKATLANVADYSSEPAQRVAYTSGRLMAQYISNENANSDSSFSSLTAYCRTRLAHARLVEHRNPTSQNGHGRQSPKTVVNPFTLATACECMKHLIKASPMYQDVMNEALAEIMVGLYAPDTIHYTTASSNLNPPELHSAAPADALFRHLQNIPYCELNKFISSDLYLAQIELHDSWLLAKRVLLVEDSLGAIIRKQLQTFHGISLRFHFNAWMDTCHCRRIWRESYLKKAIKKYRILHQSKAFCAWQACMDLADTEKRLAEATATLADEKRIIGGEIWNLQDQIKNAEHEIASLRMKMTNFTTLRDNALVWRKRGTEITGHVAAISNACIESEIRSIFPISSIFQLLPEQQNIFNPQLPLSTTIIRAVGGQAEAVQQQSTSGTSRPGTGTSRPGTSSNSKSDAYNGSRPESSYRPGSSGQLPSLEVTVAKLLSSPTEEIIARMIFAGTGVTITGWSDKLMLNGLLHSKMIDFMQMQEYNTVHKDPEATVDIWTSVLARAKQLGAVFNDSVTTPESLMAKSPVARCILIADIILNCGCPPFSPLWSTFRQRFVAEETANKIDSKIIANHKRMQLLVSSLEATQEISNQEDAADYESFEDFIKECPNVCASSLNAYRDAMEFASCMRVMQEHLRRWFGIVSLKLVNRQDVKLVDVNLATPEFPKAATKSGGKRK